MDVSKVFSNITGSKEYDRSHYACNFTRCASVEAAKEANRLFRYDIAQQFLMGCTLDIVRKTCVSSAGTCSWFDKSYGIMWVGVQGMGDSMCVVAKNDDLDMTRVCQYRQTLPKESVMYTLTKCLMSEVEGLPYDDKFRKRSGQSVKKPFGVVSVFPVTDEETGQLAINFLQEKMKSDSAITFDGTIKTAISAFQHLCLQELKAEEIWVTCWNGGETFHLHVHEIREHLSTINGSGGSTNNQIMGNLGVMNSGYGSSDLTNKVIEGISSPLTVGSK